MALEGGKARPRRAVGGRVVTSKGPKARKKGKDVGVVGSRAAAQASGARSEKEPSKRTIRTGAAAKGSGFDRGSRLRGGMRTPLGWKDQLRRYHGENIA